MSDLGIVAPLQGFVERFALSLSANISETPNFPEINVEAAKTTMEQIETMEVLQAVGAGETLGARRATGGSPARGGAQERVRAADPEVPAKARRRRIVV